MRNLAMEIHILSDLHMEFADYEIQVLDTDVIILAGDIHVGIKGLIWATKLLSQTRAHIIYIAGNHEFYRQEIKDLLSKLKDYSTQLENLEAQQRLHFLDNDELVIDGVRFLGSTLWTDLTLFGEDMKKECMLEGEQNLNDFKLIQMGEWNYRAIDSVELNSNSVNWLTKKLNTKFDGKTVVVTHHLPTKFSVSNRYQDNILSACFASNLDHLIGYCNLWVHGHTHDSFDYVKNGTRIVCNPRGYHQYGSNENEEFNPLLTVTI